MQSQYKLGPRQRLANAIGTIQLTGANASVQSGFPARSLGRAIVEFVGNGTFNAGTGADAIILYGIRRVGGGVPAANLEMLGVLGINTGAGVYPVIPLTAARNYSQLVDLPDGYDTIGVAAMTADIVLGGANTVSIFITPITG